MPIPLTQNCLASTGGDSYRKNGYTFDPFSRNIWGKITLFVMKINFLKEFLFQNKK